MTLLEQLQIQREILRKVNKRVLKQDISTNTATLDKYKVDCINAFNNFSIVLLTFFQHADSAHKLVIHQNFLYASEKLEEILLKLNLTTNIPKLIGEIINIDSVILKPIPNPTHSPNDTHEFASMSSDDEETNMTHLAKPDFLKLCASTINKNFSGDPLALQSFCNAIDLLAELATTAELRTFLCTFVKAKLDGKALEAIPANADSIEIIKTALHAKITPDNSKVIEGKMQALRTSRKSLQEFSKEAEELAEALQRSLIVEGIPQNKAQQMSIERTVEMCRTSARTDIVKSVLASSKFESPKEAIAKFIVETGTAAKEQQVLSFRASKHTHGNNSNNANNNFRKNRPNNGFIQSNNGFNQPNNRQNNNRNQRQNGRPGQFQNNNRNPNNRNNFPNNSHMNQPQYGRFNSFQNNNGYRSNSGQSTGSYQNIRTYGQGNLPAPQQLQLGDQPNQFTQFPQTQF